MITLDPTDTYLSAEEKITLEERLAARVDALGESLRKKRDDAIASRRDSGIEDEWRAAEDAYQGVDDHNRGDSRMAKPTSPYGGSVNSRVSGTNLTRSTVVLNITRAYVDAAAARVGDMMLPTDDSAWAIRPTPVSSMSTSQGQVPEMAAAPEALGASVTADAIEPGAVPVMPGQQPPVQLTPVAQAIGQEELIQSEAKEKCERATKQIEDWLVESQWHAEVRKMIEDAARLGTGILKGPTPRRVRQRSITQGESGWELVVKDDITPESRCISPWNFFPDGGCGESIHDGAYTWEVDTITGKGLRELMGGNYIDSQIKKCLEEGPQKVGSVANGYQAPRVKTDDKDLFNIWYFYGMVDGEGLAAAGVDVDDDAVASCIVTMVNDRVIKAALNPLDSGDFPYDMMPWQRKAGLPYGTGVAMQINTPQRMLTAAGRNLMDNAGLTAGPQIVMRRNALIPADGRFEITPRKIWFLNEGSEVPKVQDAFHAINIPSMQQELNNIITFALKMAEDITGLPAMMQGQNTNAPDTVGGMQMLQNNAGTVLRRIARLFDDKVTEPHIRRYYEWLMLNTDDETMKGDFQVDARGSTALVERDMQTQAIIQMGQMVGNPAFGADPEKWFTEMLKSQRLDPKSFMMDEEKKAQLAQQPPPEAPAIAAARIRAEADAAKTQQTLAAKAQEAEAERQKDLRIAQSRDGLQAQRNKVDVDRDVAYVQAQARRDEIAHQGKMAELQIRLQLATLDYANREKTTLDKVKADLAKKVMEINATRELANLKAPADLLPTPPVEPPGLAPAGESFQK